ncbi:MAG: MFS transporter [Anaerolineae bacterium]|nr:MFS transporter [Anaerolineae bacterium]
MNPVNLLFFGLFFASIGQSILAPVLPPLIRELGLSEFHGGLIMSLSAVVWVIASPIWGRRSDIWGRKPVFVMGVFGYALGVGAFGTVAQLGLNGAFMAILPLLPLALIGARMLVGLLYSAAPPTAQAYVAEVTDGPARTAAIAFIAAAGSVGTVLGPVIGAVVVPLGLVAPIFLSAGLAAVAGIVVALRLPRVKPRIQKGDAPAPRVRVRDHRVWPYLVIGVTITTTLSAVHFTAAFYFQDRLLLNAQETTQLVGLAMMGSGAATLFSQLVLVRRFQWSPVILLRVGIPLVVIAMLTMISATTFPVLLLALILQGLGMGLALPGYQSATIFAVLPQEQGAVAGLNSSIGGLGGVFGPFFGTGLYEFHMLLPYLFCLVALSLGLLLLWVHPRMRPARAAAPGIV